MENVALIFAGQGSQRVGMGKDLVEAFPSARKWFDEANTLLNVDLARLCFEGPELELTQTENAQPAIYLVSWIALQVLREQRPDLSFQAAAGLSLGEFTALAAAGAISFADGLRLVRQRGRLMQEACESQPGKMAAIIGLDETRTRAVCSEADVELANLNCPGQLVISGEAEKIRKACEMAKARGARRALPLEVAGAYHSRLMAGAAGKLSVVLEPMAISTPRVPVISNVTAQPHGDPPSIRRRLVEQVTAPVRWEASMRYLLGQGFRRFIELGPGTALTGFMRRIDSEARASNVQDRASLQATLDLK